MKDLKEWKNTRGLIGKMGKQSLKRKIQEFTIASARELNPKVIKQAKKINGQVDVARVTAVSPAAATFFAWCKGVLDELTK